MIGAARAYIDRLGFALVVADANKRPLGRYFPRGVLIATCDLAVFDEALRSCPGATLATRVGEHLVLNVDVRTGGVEQLERLEAGVGRLPLTWRAVTPSGGLHMWFRPVEFPTRGRIGGIEVLRNNRLVTLSPSRRAGRRYR